MWTRIKSLVYKEMLAVWRDKKSRIVLFVPPILQLFIFAFAATLDVTNVSIGILNRDPGEKSSELIQRFHHTSVFKNIKYLQSVSEITDYIENLRGSMVISIDQQFSRNLDAKLPVNIQIILDGRRSNSTQIIAGYAENIIRQFALEYATEVRINPQKTRLDPRNWFNPNLIYYWYNIPCLTGILTMVVGLIITTLSVARERELGTFDQLLVSPLSSLEILIGKTIPAILIGVFEGSIILLAGVFIIGVPFTGSILLLYCALFVFVCSIVGIGLFISTLCNTQQQAVLGSFVFMSPVILLSGYATPIENMPYWLQPFTYFIPLSYYLVIAKGIFLKAMPAHIVFSKIWPMAIIAIFTLSAGGWLFRRRLG